MRYHFRRTNFATQYSKERGSTNVKRPRIATDVHDGRNTSFSAPQRPVPSEMTELSVRVNRSSV